MGIDRMKTFAIKDNNSYFSLLHFLQQFSIECQIQVLRIWFPKLCFPVACDWLEKNIALLVRRLAQRNFPYLLPISCRYFVSFGCVRLLSLARVSA